MNHGFMNRDETNETRIVKICSTAGAWWASLNGRLKLGVNESSYYFGHLGIFAWDIWWRVQGADFQAATYLICIVLNS